MLINVLIYENQMKMKKKDHLPYNHGIVQNHTKSLTTQLVCHDWLHYLCKPKRFCHPLPNLTPTSTELSAYGDNLSHLP